MTSAPRFRVVSSDPVADYGFFTMDNVRVEAPDGSRAERFAIRHPGAAAVVAIDGDDVVLVEQYRAPIDRAILEIPAGKLDADDTDPAAAAARELEEETGYRARSLTPLIAIHTAVGFADEVIHIYLAKGLTAGEAMPDGIEEQWASIRRVPLSIAVAMVEDGRITDAKTVAGLLMAARMI